MNKPRPIFAAAILAGLIGAAQGQTPPPPAPSGATSSDQLDARYIKRIETRFGAFVGSSDNLESLTSGLRHGSEITLTGSGETTSFTPPTRPMGYGNVTRALDLAMRELAAAGIKDPTPSEIQAALIGGTVSTPTGDMAFRGVLELRSQGMGWGQIAHAVGVHPGLGAAKAAPVTSRSGAGVTTALGTAVSQPGNRSGQVSDSARGHSSRGLVSSAAGAAAAPGNSGANASKGQGNGTGRGGGKP